MADGIEELKRKAVLAHRVLTMTGSMGDITGHVFVRVPGRHELLARCRSDEDFGPGFVGENALHPVDFDGAPTEDLGKWVPPPERFIGIEIMKARPEINCVIHAHPPAQILCSITGVQIRPVMGAPNMGGSVMALGGIPVYPRSILVASPEIGRAMVAVMGGRDACLLAAHGNVVAGRSVEEATVRAIQLENLAKICWRVAAARKRAPTISWDDVEEILNPKQPAAVRGLVPEAGLWVWNYYVQALEKGVTLHAEMGADQS
jgi:ribulose-5-phosphate 4-epimerase/fuculose-1-phosphate aldolase